MSSQGRYERAQKEHQRKSPLRFPMRADDGRLPLGVLPPSDELERDLIIGSIMHNMDFTL